MLAPNVSHVMVRPRPSGSLPQVNEPQGYEIVEVEPTTLSDERAREAALLQQALQHERVPEDPLTPLEVYIQRMRIKPPSQWRAVFAARDASGRLAGTGGIGYSTNEPEQAHLRWCEVSVAKEHRRKGVGRALFRRLVEAVDGQRDDLVVIGQSNDRVPAGNEFAKSLGATPGLPMRLLQLLLADVDRAQVKEWAALAPAGYRLARVDGTVPADVMSAYLQAANGMNDAPKGDIDFGDWKLTEEQVHEREDWLRKAGQEWWLLVAIHEATGEGAGFTEVTYDPNVPHVIHQQGTATIPAHRGHKIGMWLKAVMLDRILAERGQAKFIRTGNANTNEQMLDINTKLGFTHAWQTTLWQVKQAEARTAVGLEAAEARS